MFNKLKTECLTLIDKLMVESSEDEKSGLDTIKNQIVDKNFCNETLVQDIAKLLEIRDILIN
jgi:hypothetical protein